jgi:hypothetical protein
MTWIAETAWLLAFPKLDLCLSAENLGMVKILIILSNITES